MILTQLSVSQIAKFNAAEDGCALRWWYRYVLKKEEPSSKKQELGTQVHTQLEHTLRHGEDVLGKVAGFARKLLPPRGSELLLEWGLHDKPRPPNDENGKQVNHFPPEQSLLRVADVPLIGFMDVVDPRPDHVLPSGELIHEPGVVEVMDFKTTGNFKWATPASELIETSQMNGYGMYGIEKYPWATGIRLSHLAMYTGSGDPDDGLPKARKESIVLPVAEIRGRWETKVADLANEIKVVAGKSETEVEGNLDACNNFGGCPHRNYCHEQKKLSPIDKLRRFLTKESKTMSLLKRPAAAAPVAPVPATANGASTTPWIPPAAPVQFLTAKDAVAEQLYKFSTGAVGKFICATGQGNEIVYAFQQVINGAAGGAAFHVGPAEAVTLVPAAAAAPAPVPPPPAQAAPPPAPAPIVHLVPPPPAQAAAVPPPPAQAAAAPPPPPAAAAAPPAAPAARKLIAKDVAADAPPAPPAPPGAPEAVKRGRGPGAKTLAAQATDSVSRIQEAIAAAQEIFEVQFGAKPSPEQALPIWQALLSVRPA